MGLSLKYHILVSSRVIMILETERIFFKGTSVLVKPGIISGGPITHECPLSRSMGYFLEPLVMLAPFAKKPLQLTLHGITTDDQDLSVRFLSLLFSFPISCER